MKQTRSRITVVAAAALIETTIGQSAELVSGSLVQTCTITDLGPSSDVIPYTPLGTLTGVVDLKSGLAR